MVPIIFLLSLLRFRQPNKIKCFVIHLGYGRLIVIEIPFWQQSISNPEIMWNSNLFNAIDNVNNEKKLIHVFNKEIKSKIVT